MVRQWTATDYACNEMLLTIIIARLCGLIIHRAGFGYALVDCPCVRSCDSCPTSICNFDVDSDIYRNLARAPGVWPPHDVSGLLSARSRPCTPGVRTDMDEYAFWSAF